jgi:hypothetical protein
MPDEPRLEASRNVSRLRFYVTYCADRLLFDGIFELHGDLD